MQVNAVSHHNHLHSYQCDFFSVCREVFNKNATNETMHLRAFNLDYLTHTLAIRTPARGIIPGKRTNHCGTWKKPANTRTSAKKKKNGLLALEEEEH